jgi:WD40 repeat protein
VLALGIILVVIPVVSAAEPVRFDVPQRTKPVDFAAEIAPILRANCLACHHEKKAEGRLVMESPQSILKGGSEGPAIVAGKGADSLLLKVAAHEGPLVMPPPDNQVGARALTSAELGLIKLWIDQGATGTVSATRDIDWKPLPAGYQPPLATAVTPDGQLAVCSRGNRLCVYHIAAGRLLTCLTDPGVASSSTHPAPVAHQDLVRCLAFDPAGELLASGSFREVKLWRRPRIARSVEIPHEGALQAVAISPKGNLAATGDEAGRIRLFEIATGKVRHTLAADSGAITGLAFAPDQSSLYSASPDKSVRVWDVSTGAAIGKPAATPSSVRGLVIVNEGQWLITGEEDGQARVWETKALREDTAEVKPLREIKAHGSAVNVLIPMPGQTMEFLSGGEDGLVRRWNAETGKSLSEIRYEGPVLAIAVRPDGRRRAAAGARGLMLWDEEGKQRAHLVNDPRATWKTDQLGARARFTKSAIDRAKQDLNSYEGLIRISKVHEEDIKKAEEERTKSEKTRDEKKAAFEKVKAENGKLEEPMRALADAETAVMVAQTVIDRAKAISERTNKQRAAAEQEVAAREAILKQQEAERDAVQAAAKATSVTFRSLAFSEDGQRLAAGDDAGVVHFFDAEAGTSLQSLADHTAAVKGATFTSAGMLVTVSADKRALVWNASNAWRLERVIGGRAQPGQFADRVLSVDFSRDGKWLATGGGVPSRSGELKVWNVANGQLVRNTPDAHTETVYAVRFSPDGQKLASAGGDRFVRLFESQTGKPLHRMAGHTGHILSLAWKADGKLLASSGVDNVIKLWDVETGLFVRPMKGGSYTNRNYKGAVTAVSFIGDSEEIIAASGDGTVRLHRSPSENEVLTYEGSKGFQYSAVATPDGRWVIGAGADGSLRVWTGYDQHVVRSLGQ